LRLVDWLLPGSSPVKSYILRFSLSTRHAYEAATFLNASFAYGAWFLSGWSLIANFLYDFLTSSSVQLAVRPSI
jgi:hypothetical protein